MMADKQ